MRIEDWRSIAPALVEPLVVHEIERWRRDLAWDASGLWQGVIEGRRAGHVAGFVALDDSGTPAGWTTFGVHRGILQVAALDGTSGEAVRALLDAVVASPEARFAERYHGFILSRHRRLAAALERRRFALESFRYLVKTLDGGHPPASALASPFTVAPWSDEIVPDVVRLLARTYAGLPTARAFAARGRLDEWTAYVGQLLYTPGCGTLKPEATLPVRDEVRQLAGILVGTALSDNTWHIAQVVVDPRHQGSGIGRWLVDEACRRAHAAGASAVTLLVSERNSGARRLYERLGFIETPSEFIFASRERVTRVAARAS